MVRVEIDGMDVVVPEHTTILDAAAAANVHIPTLCYLRGINEIGACRVCVVEVEGLDQLVASCNNYCVDGMVIRTNSPKVREARRRNLQMLLSQHRSECTSCVRSGNCELQGLSRDLGITSLPFERHLRHDPWPQGFPLIRDSSKCVNCLRCIQVCDKIQGCGVWDLVNRSSHTSVGVSGARDITASDCTLCGQCITHCPTGALRERDDTDLVWDALADPDKITVVQMAPAVRAAWGEPFGLAPDVATLGRLVMALRMMGFHYVFDTDFGADLTIMEEATELLERMAHPDKGPLPMFTSCCPGWVRYLKGHHPELTANVSTSKSPHQMFGAVAKSYLAERLGVDASQIFVLSIMPCVAKKAEAALPTMRDAAGNRDVDVVLTVRELDRMISAEHLDVATLPEAEFDRPLAEATGAAVIFGSTGGVMEAALRTAYHSVTGEAPAPDMFADVRGMRGWKEASFDLAGTELRVAVVSGLENTRWLLEAVEAGEAHYDFVEVMACPGGCAGGGGQPIHEGRELAQERGDVLWGLDRASELRNSYENPAIQELYRDYLGEPLSELSEELLHTDQFGWEMPLAPGVSSR